MEGKEQAYIHRKTLEGKNATVRVFSPILSDKERTRRMNAIHKAAASVLRAKKNGGGNG